MKIELDKTDIRFLNMVLRDIQYAPNIREGLGFRPFAYYLQKKINKEECINPIKEYEKERYNHINNIVKQKKYLFEYKDPDFETLKKVIRKRLTDLKNKWEENIQTIKMNEIEHFLTTAVWLGVALTLEIIFQEKVDAVMVFIGIGIGKIIGYLVVKSVKSMDNINKKMDDWND